MKDRPLVRALKRSVECLGSQKAVGDAAGVDQATVSRWLAGRIGWIPYDIGIHLERATNGQVHRKEFYPS